MIIAEISETNLLRQSSLPWIIMQICLLRSNSGIGSHGSVSNWWLGVQTIAAGKYTTLRKQQHQWHQKAESNNVDQNTHTSILITVLLTDWINIYSSPNTQHFPLYQRGSKVSVILIRLTEYNWNCMTMHLLASPEKAIFHMLLGFFK